jgi:hypothetical protein
LPVDLAVGVDRLADRAVTTGPSGCRCLALHLFGQGPVG